MISFIVIFVLFLILLYYLCQNKETISYKYKKYSGKEYTTKVISEALEVPTTVTMVEAKYQIRRTYIKGSIVGNFRGNQLPENYLEFNNSEFYRFEIFKAEVIAEYRTQSEGQYLEALEHEKFLNKITPNPLLVKLSFSDESNVFRLHLHDIKLANINFDKYRALQQIEDKTVFGKLEADVYGFIEEKQIIETEYEKEEIKIEQIKKTIQVPVEKPTPKEILPEEDLSETDCSILIWSILGLALFIFFTFNIGVPFLIFMGILGLIALLIYLPQRMIRFGSVIRPFLIKLPCIALLFFGLLYIMGFILFLSSLSGRTERTHYTKVPPPKDLIEETRSVTVPTPLVQDRIENNSSSNRTKTTDANIDSIIRHHRIWYDYDSNRYEGDFWITKKDIAQSTFFKNNLSISPMEQQPYERIIYEIKNNDSNKFYGIYTMFDSIKAVQNLNDTSFANCIVSFVQDIAYCSVEDRDCPTNMYNYSKNYSAFIPDCIGFQRFGIITPAEFIGSLKADCDTRTIFLYSVLKHYNYDVAVLSSDRLKHSVLGINLPYSGAHYNFNNIKYYFWETTALGMHPGVFNPFESLNSLWRISLLSKSNIK